MAKLNISPTNRSLKSLNNLVVTWIKIINLWHELENKLENRQNAITTLLSQAEKNAYIHLKPFTAALQDYIEGTAYLSLNAIDTNHFEKLLSDCSYKDRIPKTYISRIRECQNLVTEVQGFLKTIRKASDTYQFYHLKYNLYLADHSALEEIIWLENQIKPSKPTDYKIPEHRAIQVIQRLVTDFSGKKTEQKRMIDKLKNYKPITSVPPDEDDSHPIEGPRLVDF